jgi:hypothetical protein
VARVRVREHGRRHLSGVERVEDGLDAGVLADDPRVEDGERLLRRVSAG